jgi:hypothetical protein
VQVLGLLGFGLGIVLRSSAVGVAVLFGVLIVPALLVALLPSSSYEDSLRRIQVFLTARQQKFGRRAHLAVTWRRPAEDG